MPRAAHPTVLLMHSDALEEFKMCTVLAMPSRSFPARVATWSIDVAHFPTPW
jgi:hypothetical protein